VRNGSLAVFFEKDFAVNSVAFVVVPLPPQTPQPPPRPPPHRDADVEAVEAGRSGHSIKSARC